MIASDSTSYPVTGAALAAGVEPGIACRYHWALRRYAAEPTDANAARLLLAYQAGCQRHDVPAMNDLVKRLDEARKAGRLYAPELKGLS